MQHSFMNQTALGLFVQNTLRQVKQRTNNFRSNILIDLLSLLLGLFIGGLFGTLLPFFRNFLLWDGWILLVVLLGIEVINIGFYKQENRAGSMRKINIWKMGLLLGFFIDAFKVGS
nr:Hypothetical protein Ycf20 [Pedinophyceae sp. YPF-701]